METKPVQCCNCNANLLKAVGQRMEIKTAFIQQTVTRLLEKTVRVGDVLCNKCRVSFYKKKSEETERQRREEARPSSASNPQDSDITLAEAGPSHASNPQDPELILAEYQQQSLATVEIDLPRVVSTHKYCFLCGISDRTLTMVPFQARQQVFTIKRIFVPKGSRCCSKHLIKRRLYKDELNNIKIHSLKSTIDADDLKKLLNELARTSESNIVDKIGDYSLSEDHIKVFTGLSWENIQELSQMLTSLRNSHSRNVTQALVTFLFKLRTGNSNALIAAVLGLQREQQVSEFSDSVISSFEKDVLPAHLGFSAVSREQLIQNETSRMAQTLLKLNDRLAVIFDGTYVHHEKSSNNEYQRRSYSGQKKKPLCKPFTIVTTNGYIIDTLGPFSANLNDATIMEQILKDPNGITNILKPGDICIVDRGFRDVIGKLTAMQYAVMMPALKNKRKQLTAMESNESRFVTKVRWAVEAIHGILGEKYHLLHQQVDNKLLPKVGSYCRIASFLNNKFGKRLDSDIDQLNEIVSRMESRKSIDNSPST